MIKLKSLLKEWNDTSFKKLPKRWSKNINEKDGFTELERIELDEDLKVKETDIDGWIYIWKEEMEKGKFDPENPTVHLLGYGTMPYKSLQKFTANDLISIAKELKRGNVKKAHNKLIDNFSNIVLWKVKCLNDVRQELNTSLWKRRITIYKKKKKYG